MAVKRYVSGQWVSIAGVGSSAASSPSNAVASGLLNADTTVTAGADMVVPFIDQYDPNNWWDPATKRFTPTFAGYYNISYTVWWVAGAVTNNQTNSQIRKNGATFALFQNQIVTGSGYTQGGSKIIYLNGTTDYLDFSVYTSNTTSQVIQKGSVDGGGTYFSAHLITTTAAVTSTAPLTSANNQLALTYGSGLTLSSNSLIVDSTVVPLLGASNVFTNELKAKTFTVSVANTTTALDFATEGLKTMSIAANTTFTAANYAAGRTITVKITCDATQRTLTFPTNWVFVGTKPTNIAASKVGILTVSSFGTTEAECVAAWAVQA